MRKLLGHRSANSRSPPAPRATRRAMATSERAASRAAATSRSAPSTRSRSKARTTCRHGRRPALGARRGRCRGDRAARHPGREWRAQDRHPAGQRRWFGGHRGKSRSTSPLPALNGASIGRLGRHADRSACRRRASPARWPAPATWRSARFRRGRPISSISGSGDIRASGQAEQARLSIAGSGDLGARRAADPPRLGLGGRLGRCRAPGERGGRRLDRRLGRHQRPRRRPLHGLQDGLRRPQAARGELTGGPEARLLTIHLLAPWSLP